MADPVPASSAAMSIAASALRAQQQRMRVIAENLANADSVASTPGGDPYRRQVPVFTPTTLAGGLRGVAMSKTAADQTAPRSLMTNETVVANKGTLDNFLTHLVRELDDCGFLRNAPKRAGMIRNIQHFFQRGEVTDQELRTLHGIVTELAHGRGARRGKSNS